MIFDKSKSLDPICLSGVCSVFGRKNVSQMYVEMGFLLEGGWGGGGGWDCK